MKRRTFFRSLVASVATLVTAYALPEQRVRKLLHKDNGYLTILSYERLTYWEPTPWTMIVKRGAFPEGMGETIRAMNYDNQR